MSEPITSQSAFSFSDPSSFSTQQVTFTSFSPEQTSKPVTTSQPNPQTSTNFQNQQFQQYHTATLSSNNAKFPYLKKDEYETWAMKMEYWIMYTDHNLWKIIQNGNIKKSLRRDSKGRIIILPPISFEEHVAAFSEFSVSEEEGLDKGYDRALPPSWSHVALTLKTREGLEYLRFDDLYNRLRSLEIDVKGGSSYGSRSTTVAPTHSAFIGAASTNTKMVYSDQPSYSSSITYTFAPSSSIMKDNEHEEENKTEEVEQVYGLMAGFESDFAVHAGNTAGCVNPTDAEFTIMGISPKAKIEKQEWEVKFVESLARFNKWEESSKNLAKLLYSSMSTRTKLGLGFKEYIGSDEVCDLSIPSVFDPEPEDREVKSLYERFVKAETQATFGLKSNTSSLNTTDINNFVSSDNSDKSSASETYDFTSCVSSPRTNDFFSTVDVKILPKSDVKDPSPTNGFPSCSFKENVKPTRNLCNKSGLADRIHCKNNFVRSKKCLVYGSKSHLIKDCDVYDTVDNFPSVVSKAAYVPAGNRNSSASTSAGRSIPAASRNRPAYIHADRSILAASRNRPASIHAGRHIPAGRINKPAPFPAGRSVHPHVNKDIDIIDSGCSRSMTGNKEKLDDFMQVKGGTITFGGGDGKITGKGTIRTSKLNFE
nr:hypothetical protein [Tanacetum cinerariifolium]